MKKIGIYPGSFQPASRSHYQVYKKLKSMIGADVFVATTDREPIPDAPLNFGDKEQIWVRHGVPASHIVKVGSLPMDDTEQWQPQEIYSKFSTEQTISIIVLNAKEAATLSKRKRNGKVERSGLSERTKIEVKEIYEELSNTQPSATEVWLNSKNKPSYFQPYKGNEHQLKPLSQNAYIVIMDDSKIEGKSVSTTNIRNVLGSTTYKDVQKKKFFRWVFGWFDVGLYQLMVSKFRHAHQSSSTETIPPQSLQEMVYTILKELAVQEDFYSTTINDPASDTMDSNMDDQKSMAQQRSDASKTRTDLIQAKKSAEAKSKQNKQQRDSYATTVKNYDSIQKKADREELDGINSQLSSPAKPIAPTI